MDIKLDKLTTEARNPLSMNLSNLTIEEMLRVINEEDKKIPYAIESEIEKIAEVVKLAADALRNGGRLIYLGAGTSGRLGVLDAVECRPTYGVEDEIVQGIMAGGIDAMFKAKEGAEDSKELAVEDLKQINLSKKDILVGVAASGRTPYVIGGLEYGNSIGVTTVSIACNRGSEMANVAKIAIEPIVGPEVVTGSTRMKSGTAQKLVLNMISTGTMIQLGKVYSNLMVDVKASNLKLVERAKRIVMEATGCEREVAIETLEETQYDVKLAIFMLMTGLKIENAKNFLNAQAGHISKAIMAHNKKREGGN